MGSTREGMLNVLITTMLQGGSEVCTQYTMEQGQISSQFLTMTCLIFAGLILLTLSFVHSDKIFSIINNHEDAISLLIFSVVNALTIQLTFLLIIEESNTATAMVLQFLSPTIIVTWFSLMRKSRLGIPIFCTILTSLVGTFLLVTHGSPTSLSIFPTALSWGIASAFVAAFHTTYPSTPIARYGTLSVVGWSMLIDGLILLPFYARRGTNLVVNGSLILAFFYLVVISTSLTFSLYLKGTQLTGSLRASTLSCTEPLSSALLSLLLLGITLTLPDWLGTLLILSSVALISMGSHRRARKIDRSARRE